MKPQDVIVLIKLHNWRLGRWTIAEIANSIILSTSATFASIKRLEKACLFDPVLERPRQTAMEEFIIHGLKYTYPGEIGEITQGMPTSHSASPLIELIKSNSNDQIVWPYKEGATMGRSLEPLYKTAPQAAAKDKILYEYLVLIDALRIGRAREVAIAKKELIKRIRKKK